jgi:hypothetical protein
VRIDRVARDEAGHYQVTVGTGEVRHPTILTTALVRSVASMFLSEVGGYDELDEAEREPVTDLAAVMLGFGVLVANGSYIYMKGCGSVQVHSATRLPVAEAALALAIYCALHGEPPRNAAKHLEVTPRELFDEASVWSSSNAAAVRLLRSDPALVEDDEFTLGPARSWLGRIFAGKRKSTALPTSDDLAELERALAEAPSAAPRATRDPKRAQRLAEIKGLLDEA